MLGNITLIFCFENCMFAWYVLEKYVFLLAKVVENCRKVEKYAENMQKVEENEVSVAF